MIGISRSLALASALLWLVTLVVPVFESGDLHGSRARLLALGTGQGAFGGFEFPYVLLGVAILLVVAASWLTRSSRWSIFAVVVAFVWAFALYEGIVDAPMLTWMAGEDEATAQVVEAEPAAGALAWLAGILFLVAASVLHVVAAERSVQASV